MRDAFVLRQIHFAHRRRRRRNGAIVDFPFELRTNSYIRHGRRGTTGENIPFDHARPRRREVHRLGYEMHQLIWQLTIKLGYEAVRPLRVRHLGSLTVEVCDGVEN